MQGKILAGSDFSNLNLVVKQIYLGEFYAEF